MTKITAQFQDGTSATRETEHAYLYASKRDGQVRFHKTYEAAQRRVGRRRSDNVIVPTDYYSRRASAAVCVVCQGTRKVTYGPSAVDGTFDMVDCHRCMPRAS